LQENGSPTRVAKALNINVRNVFRRRSQLAKSGLVLQTYTDSPRKRVANAFGPSYWKAEERPYTPRAHETVKDGRAFIFSDSHYHPGEPPVAHEALCLLAKKLQPKLIIGNGDLLDGSTISRHDVLGWHKPPTVVDELSTVKQRLSEIERAA